MDAMDSNLADTQDLPSVAPADSGVVRVEVAARSEVGRVRKNNEDHYLVGRISRSQEVLQTNLEGPLLPSLRQEVGYAFVVADGMGGMASGEEASRLAIITGLELVRDAPKWHLNVEDPAEAEGLQENLRKYFRQVNRRVYQQASAHTQMEGMGTTLTMAYSIALRLFLVHVGDSRAYLYHDRLQQLTSDHTLAQDLADAGQIRPDEVKSHRMRHVLTNYIGSPEEGIEAELHRLDLADGDRLLVCSDGMTDQVDDDAIAEVLGRSATPRDACDELIRRALDAGGRDNVTVIVAFYRVEDA